MALSWLPPTTIIATARAITRYRNFKLDPTIQRIIGRDLPAPSGPLSGTWSVFVDPELGTNQLGRPDCHDFRSDVRAFRENRQFALNAVDADLVADKDQRLRVRVRPCVAVRVVEHRGVWENLRRRAAGFLVFNRGRLNAQPFGRLL